MEIRIFDAGEKNVLRLAGNSASYGRRQTYVWIMEGKMMDCGVSCLNYGNDVLDVRDPAEVQRFSCGRPFSSRGPCGDSSGSMKTALHFTGGFVTLPESQRIQHAKCTVVEEVE